MACNFVTSTRLNSNGLLKLSMMLSIYQFHIGSSLSSTSIESKGSALRSKLGGSILCPKAFQQYANLSNMINVEFKMLENKLCT